MGTQSQRQIKGRQLIPRHRDNLSQPVTRFAGTVDDAGDAGPLLRQEVKVIVQQLHLDSGFVHRAGRQGESLRSKNQAVVDVAREAAGPVSAFRPKVTIRGLATAAEISGDDQTTGRGPMALSGRQHPP